MDFDLKSSRKVTKKPTRNARDFVFFIHKGKGGP